MMELGFGRHTWMHNGDWCHNFFAHARTADLVVAACFGKKWAKLATGELKLLELLLYRC